MHPTWKWLMVFGLGLMLVRDFAPISDFLDEIMTAMTMAIMAAFSGAYFWQARRARQQDRSS